MLSVLTWGRRCRFERKYAIEREGKPWFPLARALVKSAVSSFKARHAGTIRHLRHADLIVLPSPLAKQRYSRFLLALHCPELVGRLRVAPYAATPDMIYDARIPKKPVVVAVGRWQTVQKNTPLLGRVVERLLQEQPQYSVRIIGEGVEQVRKYLRTAIAQYGPRVDLVGYVDHKSLAALYQDCQIMLCTSYHESFHIASGEALCCGCSVVGDTRISSMPYFTQFGSGTVACDLSTDNIRDALFAEIDAWRAGDRDPVQISKIWSGKLHPDRVAQAILNLA